MFYGTMMEVTLVYSDSSQGVEVGNNQQPSEKKIVKDIIYTWLWKDTNWHCRVESGWIKCVISLNLNDRGNETITVFIDQWKKHFCVYEYRVLINSHNFTLEK